MKKPTGAWCLATMLIAVGASAQALPVDGGPSLPAALRKQAP
jgi:hypothetical protein